MRALDAPTLARRAIPQLLAAVIASKMKGQIGLARHAPPQDPSRNQQDNSSEYKQDRQHL
jgi:hypothetical protein